MKIYFDEGNRSNLDTLVERDVNGLKIPWLTFHNHYHNYWRNAGFKHVVSKDYSDYGIYPVSVRCNVDWWSGKAFNIAPTKHILEEIPEYVISAAREKKISILIDNQTEAANFLSYTNFDGFQVFHETMYKLGLEYGSVILWDGNIKFNDNYNKWLLDKNEKRKIIHEYFMPVSEATLGGQPLEPCILDAIKNSNSKDFNSLNRSPKVHRLDHLYFIIKNQILLKGLVSGHYSDNLSTTKRSLTTSQVFSNEQDKYSKTLYEFCPLTIDGIWVVENPDNFADHIINLKIFRNSLLSVVTESSFYGSGLFLTEKTFKPIIAGHPFIILGQPGTLEHLRSMGFKTEFSGIDSSYDDILNDKVRFLKANVQLLKWVYFSREEKLSHIEKSLPTIMHNFNTIRNYKFIQKLYDKLFVTIKQTKESLL